MYLYHIAEVSAWEQALSSGFYAPSSLKTEGFVHCSTEVQLFDTIERHFSNETELLVLTLVEKFVKTKLKWEEAPSVKQLFPHIYGKVPLEAVESITTWIKNNEGVWEKA